MKKSYELVLSALGGVLCYSVIIPCLETAGSLFQNYINKKIYKWQLDMQLDNAETQAAAEVIQPNVNNIQAIGFEVPTEPDDSEEWCHGKRQRNF